MAGGSPSDHYPLSLEKIETRWQNLVFCFRKFHIMRWPGVRPPITILFGILWQKSPWISGCGTWSTSDCFFHEKHFLVHPQSGICILGVFLSYISETKTQFLRRAFIGSYNERVKTCFAGMKVEIFSCAFFRVKNCCSVCDFRTACGLLCLPLCVHKLECQHFGRLYGCSMSKRISNWTVCTCFRVIFSFLLHCTWGRSYIWLYIDCALYGEEWNIMAISVILLRLTAWIAFVASQTICESIYLYEHTTLQSLIQIHLFN